VAAAPVSHSHRCEKRKPRLAARVGRAGATWLEVRSSMVAILNRTSACSRGLQRGGFFENATPLPRALSPTARAFFFEKALAALFPQLWRDPLSHARGATPSTSAVDSQVSLTSSNTGLPKTQCSDRLQLY